MIDPFTRLWWLMAMRGAAGILLGLVAVLWPSVTLELLLEVFAVYIVVDGVFAFGAGSMGDVQHRPLWPLALEGALGIAFGAAILAFPDRVEFLLQSFLALWAVATGALEIFAAGRLPRQSDGGVFLVAAGAASFLLGMVLLFWPGAAVVALKWAIGVYAALFGLALTVVATQIRRGTRVDDIDHSRWAV